MAFTDFTSKDGYSITPSDTVRLAKPAESLLIGVAGNVRILTPSGTDITYPLQAGINAIEALQVFSTGTTATGIFGLRS